ncbi:MAG: class I SAM-dependent methyltransferase [Halobacteriota archaeon]
MEEHHWHTAKHALAMMPVEAGDRVLDLGTGSGYALRALRETRSIGAGCGLDGSPAMLENAASYTDDDAIDFVRGDFGALPIRTDSIDHIFSMEAFYYAPDPVGTLTEVHRILRAGGTFYCAVNFFEESRHSHEWQDRIPVPMTLWSRRDYRRAFRAAGLTVAAQTQIPDLETEIPPAESFPLESWETREAMVERYRDAGTLLTVGVA